MVLSAEEPEVGFSVQLEGNLDGCFITASHGLRSQGKCGKDKITGKAKPKANVCCLCEVE